MIARRNNPPAQILQRDRNPVEEQRIKYPFQNFVLEEEQELTQEEGDAKDNIKCMEYEFDPSFLTQSNYEETIMNEHITEEALYQEDDQGGYNLRSRIVAPVNKSSIPTKDLFLLKRLVLHQKRWLLLQNSCKSH